jgi:hypothetical protein
VGNDRTDAARSRCIAIALRIIALIGQGGARRDVWADVEEDLKVAAVAGLPTRKVEGERLALEVGLEVDLGPETTA